MTTITTRAGKGSPLLNSEVDANFTNLNTDKAELSGAAFTGAITTNSTFDGRDVATDGTKLDGIEASADVTDTANVTAAGALMDSELTSEASVKALNQGVATTDSPTFAGLTTTADVSFGDNDKAIFGAGSDLQIYHTTTGNHSIIAESGSGNLVLAADNLEINNAANNANKITATTGGAVTLYHNNSVKLATTSTGIDVTGTAVADSYDIGSLGTLGSVATDRLFIATADGLGLQFDFDNSRIVPVGADGSTYNNNVSLGSSGLEFKNLLLSGNATVGGTVTADGLTVDGASTLSATDSATNTVTTGLKVGHNTSGTTANGFGSALEFEAENSTYSSVSTHAKIESVVTDQISIHSDLNVYTKYNNSLQKRMSFNNDGDISFYEDTGTSPKMVWSASNESLTFGTNLAITTNEIDVATGDLTLDVAGDIILDADGGDVILKDGGTEFMAFYNGTIGRTGDLTLDASGDIILDADDEGKVNFKDGGTQYARIDNNGGTGLDVVSTISDGDIRFRGNDGGSTIAALTLDMSAAGAATFNSGATFASSVGIGQSSPTSPLHVKSGANNDNSIITIEGATNNIFELGYATAGAFLNSAAGDPMVFRINETERMRIDSSGNLLVGTTTAAVANGTTAGIAATSGDQLLIGTSSDVSAAFNRITSDGDIVLFRKDGTTVGNIGARGGDVYLETGDTGIRMFDASNAVIPVGSTGVSRDAAIDLGVSNIRFKDLWLTNKAYANYIGASGDTDTNIYFPGSNQIRFYGGGSEYSRFDGSGNLLVGKTATDLDVAGSALFNTGQAYHTRSGDTALYLNRLSSDGTIADFRKDGTTVGSIGCNGAAIHLASGTTGIRVISDNTIRPSDASGAFKDNAIDLGAANARWKDLYLSNEVIFGSSTGSIGVSGSYLAIGNASGLRFDDSLNRILPFNTETPTATNGTLDIGSSGGRFKDLYLSGGVYLGGTAAANHLDDYEEGDYDVTIATQTSGTVTLNSSFNRAQYTKVGRTVHVSGFLVVSSVSSPVGYFTINLPFTPANLTDRAADSTASLVIQGVVSANISDFIGSINEAQALIYVQLGDATTVQNDSANQLQADTYIHFSATYAAA